MILLLCYCYVAFGRCRQRDVVEGHQESNATADKVAKGRGIRYGVR